MSDPRAALPDPRIPVPDTRANLTVCTCGLPNCPRVHHHTPVPQGPGFSPEAHYLTPHGMALPLGGGPVGHVDPSVLYSMQGAAAYGLKESPDVLRSLPQINGYYPYDPTSVYPYMNGYAGIDARRKNATKESTNTLKAWLFEHRKNPYPTKGEKIMLAILTKMTLTQVSTWFANARRRLKKENKMTWSSKDDDLDGDDDVTSEHNSDVTERANVSGSSGDCDDGRLHGSIGDDDDVLSVTSAGDRSEIDVEEHGDDIVDGMSRIPPMLPHPMNPSGRNTMFLSNHGQPMYSPLLSSMSKVMTSPEKTDTTDESVPGRDPHTQRDPSFANRLAPVSEPQSKPNHIVPITPPPSPKEAKSNQSPPLSHPSPARSHHSSATIHHHPKSSASSGSVTNASPSAHSSSSSSSSPSKPKIWSIADVVSNKDSEASKSHNHTNGDSKQGNPETSPIITIGGAPSRIERLHAGIPHPHVVPGAEGAYGMAYYPYGLHHPAAAAALMASQASHLVSRVHPYSRLGVGLHGHPVPSHPHPLPHSIGQSRPGYGSPLVTVSPSHPHSSLVSSVHKSPGSTESQMAADAPKTPEVSGSVTNEVTPSCKTTAFTPVAQRQA